MERIKIGMMSKVMKTMLSKNGKTNQMMTPNKQLNRKMRTIKKKWKRKEEEKLRPIKLWYPH